MTLQQLNQYPYMDAKIERLRRDIDDLKGNWAVSGAVMASAKSPPYNMREIIVGDRDTTKEAAIQISEKRKELECVICEKAEIEQFIKSVEDMRIKEIMTFRYLYGETWKEVAAHFGNRETEGSVKMAVKRFFKTVTNVTHVTI